MDIMFYCVLVAVILHEVYNESFPRRQKLQPTFLATPKNVTVHRGELAVLKCHIKDLGPKVVVWRKLLNDVPLTIGGTTFEQEENRISVKAELISEEEDISHWDLYIKDAQPEHGGTYMCQVTASKLYTHYVTLQVLDVPQIVSEDLQLSGTKYVNQGETIRLVCNFTTPSDDPLGVDWFFEGNIVKTTDLRWRDRATITRRTNGQTYISELIIDRSSLSEMGVYLCRVQAPSLMIRSERVDVLSAGKPVHRRGSVLTETDASYSQARDSSNGAALPPGSSGLVLVVMATLTVALVRAISLNMGIKTILSHCFRIMR
ncbi:uncharacterized protein LOC128228347 [Mya arenaria]|uniref:uncharacterized protein LOC128228347 n=1 Tax=Mya arenaria TaxID=6604 RepID=UPI0022E22674|nr:uncharacterized protein LOC128228347 [Mya arenaria]